MKNKVIEFFQNLPETKTDQFNLAFQLYRDSPNKSESIERVINASGYSELTLSNLLYDLQKMHGITDVEKLPIEKPIAKSDFRLVILDHLTELTRSEFKGWIDELKQSNTQITELYQLATDNDNQLALVVLDEIAIYKDKIDLLQYLIDTPIEEVQKEYEIDINGCLQRLDFALKFATSENNNLAVDKIKLITEALQIVSNTNLSVVKSDELTAQNNDLKFQNEELEVENEDLKNQLEESKSVPIISAETIRDEFPFLKEKECPNELKILVADKITAWNKYVSIKEEIANAGENSLDKEQLEVLAKKAIDLFQENQKIYDELNYYKENEKILGKHPLFRTLQLSREVEEMTPDELVKYKGSTSKFFTDNNKKLSAAETANDLEKIEEINEKISARKEKLELVDKKLGIKK